MKNEKLTMTVTMQVTPSQALALRAMFEYWNRLSGIGSSREVGFYVDGDGNFHPTCEFHFSTELPELTPELKQAAIVRDKNGDRLYDYDPVAWQINYPELITSKTDD